MGAAEVEVVRALYRAWDRGESAAEFVHPELVYVNPPDAVEGGVRHGRAALASVRDVYPDFRVVPEQIYDLGERVVVVGVAHGTGVSGLTTQWRQGYVWTIRDGRAVEFAWFNDPREALKHVGLDDWPEPVE
jgi:ketosteroid isomerase-like protein